jgi:hypothetical protein
MHRTFEQQLYEAMGHAYPGLTVRSMSKFLGKSTGYWSSMTSQKLPLPTETLMYLSDLVECQKIMLPWGSGRALKLEKVQSLLCEEFSARLAMIRSYLKATDPHSDEAWVQKDQLHTNVFEPLPFLIGRY